MTRDYFGGGAGKRRQNRRSYRIYSSVSTSNRRKFEYVATPVTDVCLTTRCPASPPGRRIGSVRHKRMSSSRDRRRQSSVRSADPAGRAVDPEPSARRRVVVVDVADDRRPRALGEPDDPDVRPRRRRWPTAERKSRPECRLEECQREQGIGDCPLARPEAVPVAFARERPACSTASFGASSNSLANRARLSRTCRPSTANTSRNVSQSARGIASDKQKVRPQLDVFRRRLVKLRARPNPATSPPDASPARIAPQRPRWKTQRRTRRRNRTRVRARRRAVQTAGARRRGPR